MLRLLVTLRSHLPQSTTLLSQPPPFRLAAPPPSPSPPPPSPPEPPILSPVTDPSLRLLARPHASIHLGLPSHPALSVSARPLHEALLQKWPLILSEPAFQGYPVSHFSVPASLPEPAKEGWGGRDGSSVKPPSGCLDRNAIADAASVVSPAVVNISHVSAARSYYGMMLGKSIGCGTIIDSDGTILTCAHVVIDRNSPKSVARRKVDVTLQDGRLFEGTVLSVDFHSDIALIKINSKAPLPAARLGSSSKLRPGEWVIALGCPLSLQNTVTAGIISCVDRKSSDLGLGGVKREYLQTDCAINEGNSGGPLVNLDGEVVGVNIMKIAAADGLSFAVPIDSVAKIMEHFKKSGRVVRPWLGLKMLDLNDAIIEHLKERDSSFPNVRKGVLVPMVTPGSPAERAGFEPGDVVIEFDGKAVKNIEEIVNAMGDRVGEAIPVIVKRANNRTVVLTVTPEEANM